MTCEGGQREEKDGDWRMEWRAVEWRGDEKDGMRLRGEEMRWELSEVEWRRWWWSKVGLNWRVKEDDAAKKKKEKGEKKKDSKIKREEVPEKSSKNELTYLWAIFSGVGEEAYGGFSA
jgi:hypothetical protein